VEHKKKKKTKQKQTNKKTDAGGLATFKLNNDSGRK